MHKLTRCLSRLSLPRKEKKKKKKKEKGKEKKEKKWCTLNANVGTTPPWQQRAACL